MATVLARWRQAERCVVFGQNVSSNKGSPLQEGFAGTNLRQLLKKKRIMTIVVVGFTTNHCVDATCRAAAELGFRVFVLSDSYRLAFRLHEKRAC